MNSPTHSQREALRTDMSTFVQASAGSGKTAVLVQRYIAILQDNPHLNSSHILAITFTQKAAEEMVSRVQSILEKKGLPPLYTHRISTIHGLCSRLLKQYASEAKVSPHFQILDAEDSLFLWNEALEKTISTLKLQHSEALGSYLLLTSLEQLKEDVSALFYVRDRLSQLTTLTQEALSAEKDFPTREALMLTTTLIQLSQICITTYTQLKTEQNALDYTDLVVKTHALVKIPLVRHDLHTQIFYIMVDEFQDTDPLQWDIIQTIAGYYPTQIAVPKNLFLVGDSRQSIYAFRGADASLFNTLKTRFLQHYANSTLVQLLDNFRTQKPVLDVLNPMFEAVFSDNVSLTSQRQETHGYVKVHRIEQEKSDLTGELDISCSWIKDLMQKHPELQWKDFGLLLRRKKSMAAIQAHLHAQNIPAIIEGEFRDISEDALTLLALLKTLYFPKNTLPAIRVLSELFKLDNTQLHTLYTQKTKPETLFKEWLQWAKVMPASALLDRILSGQNWPLNPEKTAPLLNKLRKYENTPFITPKTVIKKCELGLSLPQKEPIDLSVNAVRILSIHAAKGLEFPAVIIPECGKKFNFSASDRLLITPQGIGLSLMQDGEQKNTFRKKLLEDLKPTIIEEEKRIFYVACTRARDHLLLIGTQKPETKKREGVQSYVDFWR